MPSSSSLSWSTAPVSPVGPAAAMAESSTTRATRLSSPRVPDSRRASTPPRAAARRPCTSRWTRTEASERSSSSAISPEAPLRVRSSRSASAARKRSSMRDSARPAAPAWPASRSRVWTVSSTWGRISSTRSASGPAAMLSASSEKVPAARWARASQRPSGALASTGRRSSRRGGSRRWRCREARPALVSRTAAPMPPAASRGRCTAQAAPAAVAPTSRPQGSTSSSLNATSSPRRAGPSSPGRTSAWPRDLFQKFETTAVNTASIELGSEES